ncbi:hypothetical protein ACFX1Q_009896 [Malus domestica]
MGPIPQVHGAVIATAPAMKEALYTIVASTASGEGFALPKSNLTCTSVTYRPKLAQDQMAHTRTDAA